MTSPKPDLLVDHHAATLDEQATATFSACRTYRYALTRVWDQARPLAAFVMLNPSTATAFAVDPTIRRCLGFARRWGAGGLLVVNAFALRATDPRELRHHPDPVGPDNDTVIAAHYTAGGPLIGSTIVAWGIHGVLHDRARRVLEVLREHGVQPRCLGVSKGGHPRHPLYLPANTPNTPYAGVVIP